eukprot:6485889-Pyramimonas_sp.AAC.1
MSLDCNYCPLRPNELLRTLQELHAAGRVRLHQRDDLPLFALVLRLVLRELATADHLDARLEPVERVSLALGLRLLRVGPCLALLGGPLLALASRA